MSTPAYRSEQQALLVRALASTRFCGPWLAVSRLESKNHGKFQK